MLSEAGYFGTPAAPGPNSALINGIGEWDCSQATQAQQCKQINSPPEFTFKAGEKIRFRLINAGVHAMFFYSVDEHTLNVTEADGTGVYGRKLSKWLLLLPPFLHLLAYIRVLFSIRDCDFYSHWFTSCLASQRTAIFGGHQHKGTGRRKKLLLEGYHGFGLLGLVGFHTA
jgi:hypothetical protein